MPDTKKTKKGLAKYGFSLGNTGLLILANLGYALGINLFLEDNQIAAGGFSALDSFSTSFSMCHRRLYFACHTLFFWHGRPREGSLPYQR